MKRRKLGEAARPVEQEGSTAELVQQAAGMSEELLLKKPGIYRQLTSEDDCIPAEEDSMEDGPEHKAPTEAGQLDI